MINKSRFRVANDKKLLRKVGKQWVTVSALTLALLGGGALATSVVTHADTTTPAVEAQNTNNVKKQLNSNLDKAYQANQSASGNSVSSSKASQSSSTSAQSGKATKPSAVQSQANNMYRGLMMNATKPSVKSSANDMNILSLGTPSQQNRGWNFVQEGIRNNDYAPANQSGSGVVNNRASGDNTTPVSSSNAKSNVAPSNSVSASAKPSFNSAYRSYMAQMSGTDSEVASANAVNADSNSNKNENNKALLKDNAQPNFFSGKVVKTGNDLGLNYKVYANNNVEFTDGTAKSNLNDFSSNSDVHGAPAIKFDSNINTSHVTNMSNMFSGDIELQSLDLGSDFDTHNVTNMSNMFSSDSNLQSLTLPSSFNTNQVKDMHYMFENDNALQSLTLPNSFDTSNVLNMISMFMADYSLQSLTIQSPKTAFDTKKSLSFSSFSSSFVPTLYKKDTNDNYTSATPNDFSKGNVGTFVPENLAPVADVINYQYKGNTVGSAMTQKEKYNSTNAISNIANVPEGYSLKNPNQQITYNGGTYNVPVIKNDLDTVIFEYQPDNSKKNYQVASVTQMYGQDGSNYTLQKSDVPTGYQLVTPNDNSFTYGNFTNNQVKGNNDSHVFLVKPIDNSTDIPAIPNTVNIKGTVTLHFSDNGKTRDIKLDYLTQDSDDKQINLLNNVDYSNGSNMKPSDFVKDNTNIQGFDVSNFTYSGATNNYDGTQYTPSKSDTDYNHGSTNLVTQNITLNFEANSNTDPIQNGSTSTIEYTDNGKVIGSKTVNSHTGSQVNPASYVPNGYHVASDNNGQKSFTNDGSTHNIEVVGNTVPNTSITVKQSNGTTAQVPVKGHKIGDKITINPGQYAPKGYSPDSNDNPITVTIVPSNNHQGYSFQPSGNDTDPNATNNVFKGNTVSYNYHYDPDKAGNTVTVKYRNHAGKIVGTKTYNVPKGTKINPNDNVPSDYTNDGTNNSPITAPSDGKPSTYTYNVKGTKSASQLPSSTNQGKVELHIVEKNNGNQVNSYNVQVDEGSTLVGSDFTIDPTDKSLVPKGYALDGTDKTITGVITDNGAITDSGTDTLVYNAQGKQGYNIHYQNPSDPNDSSKDIVQPTNDDKTGQHLTNADVPHGYHLPSDTSFSFNSDGNIINDKTGQQVPDNRVPLEGNDIQGKANIVLKYQILDPTGENVVKTVYNNADDAQIILNGQVGGSQTINPWRYWKKDYTLPAGVANQSDTIHFTPSDVNGNNENGQQFNPTLTYTATAQQAGDVVVQYVNVDEPIKDSKGNITGYQPIKLSNGKSDTQDLGNFNDLVGQTVRLGQKESSDNDTNINNDSDVKYVLAVPQGYHLEHNANPITLAIGQEASSNPAVHYPKRGLGMLFNASRFYHRPVGLFLTVGLTRPMTPKKPKSSSAKPAHKNSVAPVKPSSATPSSASAQPSSASTAPSSVAPSSASQSVAPVAPSSNSVAPVSPVIPFVLPSANTSVSSQPSSVTPASSASVSTSKTPVANVSEPIAQPKVRKHVARKPVAKSHAKKTARKAIHKANVKKTVAKPVAKRSDKHLQHAIKKATHQLDTVEHHVNARKVAPKAKARKAVHAKKTIKVAQHKLAYLHSHKHAVHSLRRTTRAKVAIKHAKAQLSTAKRSALKGQLNDKSKLTTNAKATANEPTTNNTNVAPVSAKSVSEPSAPKSNVANQSTATTYTNNKKLPQTSEATVHSGVLALIAMAVGAVFAVFGKAFDRKRND